MFSAVDTILFLIPRENHLYLRNCSTSPGCRSNLGNGPTVCLASKRIAFSTEGLAKPGVFCIWHTVGVAWDVEFTDEFRNWWDALSEEQQDDVAHSVRHLIEFGPALGFPHSSKVGSSRCPQMRELRTQSAGRPLRTLYAFNPLRSAILLIGATRPATTAGMRGLCRSRTGFLNDTYLNSRRREAFNAHSQFP